MLRGLLLALAADWWVLTVSEWMAVKQLSILHTGQTAVKINGCIPLYLLSPYTGGSCSIPAWQATFFLLQSKHVLGKWLSVCRPLAGMNGLLLALPFSSALDPQLFNRFDVGESCYFPPIPALWRSQRWLDSPQCLWIRIINIILNLPF